jgi:NADPH-dependent glutamate synthase beta subunit-like oxidoreductase
VLNERTVFAPPVQADLNLCTHCESCLSVGCPAIGFEDHNPRVNQELCNGCSMCQQVCYNCPAANDVGGFLQLALDKKYDEAYAILLKSNPFPSLTGRVCPHPCEAPINALGYDLAKVYARFAGLSKKFGTGEPGKFSVRDVEKFLGDYGLEKDLNGERPALDGRVAVVGSGPAGLTAAYYLAEMGYAVTVFEQLPVIGGMLRAGIPDFRLSHQILEKNLDRLRAMGVEFRTGVAVGKDISFEKIDRDHDAVFFATGFSEARPMGVPGEDLGGVVHGVSLLRQINLGGKPEIGKHVLVVGGGNTAMDVARSVKRRGASPKVVYRRSEEDMPAIPEEIEALREEGIPLVTYAAPVGIEMVGGRLRVTFVRMKPGASDASGRPRPVPIERSEYTEEYDQVVAAVGERAGLSNLPKKLRHDEAMVATDFSTATNLEGVFAGGDLSTGFGTVAHAIRSGRKAADAIHAYIAGKAR